MCVGTLIFSTILFVKPPVFVPFREIAPLLISFGESPGSISFLFFLPHDTCLPFPCCPPFTLENHIWFFLVRLPEFCYTNLNFLGVPDQLNSFFGRPFLRGLGPQLLNFLSGSYLRGISQLALPVLKKGSGVQPSEIGCWIPLCFQYDCTALGPWIFPALLQGSVFFTILSVCPCPLSDFFYVDSRVSHDNQMVGASPFYFWVLNSFYPFCFIWVAGYFPFRRQQTCEFPLPQDPPDAMSLRVF